MSQTVDIRELNERIESKSSFLLMGRCNSSSQ